MSASRTKKERQAEALAGLSQKQIKEQSAAKKAKRNVIIYTVIGIVAVLCVAALLIWDSGVIQKHSTAVTIGQKDYGVVDLDFYYYSAYANYSSNASLYGLDTETPLDEQEVYEGYTWDQMLKDTAIDALSNIAMLSQEAEAEGYELSDEGKDSVQYSLINNSTYATLYGVTEKYFLQANYGKYMTVKDYERILTEAQLAQEYSEYKVGSFDVSEDEIDAYYEENSADLDTIDYNCYLISFDRTEKDADGNSVDLDEATIEANRAEAEQQAQEILDALKAGDQAKVDRLVETYGAVDDSNMSGISYSGFADWMADSSHQAGSSDLVENISAVSGQVIGYFAIQVNDRYLDDYTGAKVRVLTVKASADEDGNYDMDECVERAEGILADYEATDMSSETFAQMCDDAAGGTATYPGGLRENLSKKVFNEEMTEWIFSGSRKQGDYQMFTDEEANASYIVYFEGRSDTPYWKTVSISNVQSQKYSDWQTETAENYAAVNGFGMRFVG